MSKKFELSAAATAVLAVLGFVLVIGIWFSSNWNSLVVSKAQVDKSWSMVETQYQRRLDLIDNLVETVKGAQGQEQKVFGELAAARANYAGSRTSSEQAAAAGNMETALARLLVITENYPELRSNENVKALAAELGRTEDGIAAARDAYNTTATNYNVNITRFPKSIFASAFDFKKQELFKAAAGADKAPKVKF